MQLIKFLPVGVAFPFGPPFLSMFIHFLNNPPFQMSTGNKFKRHTVFPRLITVHLPQPSLLITLSIGNICLFLAMTSRIRSRKLYQLIKPSSSYV